jgi:hypothetical protein
LNKKRKIMKKNYTIKTAMLLLVAVFGLTNAFAQVRIAKLDPSTNTVTLKNYGTSNVPISGYWFCNYPAYGQVSNMTGVASLDAGEEVIINSSINFNVGDGEFGLYNSSNFGSSTAMEDYLQWGNAGHVRESVAVAKGIWAAGTFVDLAGPYAYSGTGSQNGAEQWIMFRDVRIIRINPATDVVRLKNFGTEDVNISGYWFCNFPAYGQVSSMTGVSTLSPGEEIDINSSIDFNVADGEFGLYNTNVFTSSTAMEDYVQWGSANHTRESVAVAKGIWEDDAFLSAAPPYEYTGNGSQDGVAFWSTLSTANFELDDNFKLYPNPSNAILNVQLQNSDNSSQIQVFDMLGKQIHHQEMSSNEMSSIDVSNWNNGLYVVKITSNNNTSTKRFIKQ